MSASNPLSEREREILRLVATGLANKEVASALSISPNTVKVHLRNIFEKIGAASRTEAAMYAVREGLVEGLSGAPIAEGARLAFPPARPWWKSVWVWLGVGVALTMLAGAGVREWLLPAPVPTATVPGATASLAPTATPVSRWQVRAPMLTARSGLAAAAYENQIYAIGGETDEGVTGALERYNPRNDTWTALPPKPLPVADIGAAVIGGKIYVPGGRTAEGTPTDVVEVFDPRAAAWSLSPPLPAALSAYALAAFEGKLYLFGGWDGTQFVASVFAFDPDTGAWGTLTPMPSARAFARAAAAGGELFVMGGADGTSTLDANLQYLPERDAAGDDAWIARAPLPETRQSFALAGTGELVYLLGSGTPLEYSPQRDEWKTLAAPDVANWHGMGLIVQGPNLIAFGGSSDGRALPATLSYQAVYTIAIPLIQ
jgi:DNA-binding CsgD family transcriptional regulator